MVLSKKLLRQAIAITLIVLLFVLAAFLAVKQQRNESDSSVMSNLSEELLESLPSNTDPTLSGLYSDTKPATGDNVTTTETYTDEYMATLPEDISREEILDKQRIDAFVSVNKGELLPPVYINEDLVIEDSTPEIKEAYLNQISPETNSSLYVISSDLIDQALADHLSFEKKTITLQATIGALEKNIDILSNVKVPLDMVSLHKKNLAAYYGLLNNVRLLANIDNDLIGGIIGSYNIGELGIVFREISAEINSHKSE